MKDSLMQHDMETVTRVVTGTHLHFVIYCAHMKREGTFLDNTIVEVVADTEANALIRARTLAPDRAHYFVHSILEHHSHDHSG